MANTYTQIYLQVVFAVSGRRNLIKKFWRDDLYKYITGIIMNHGHYLLAINGMPDHIHLFFRYRQTQTIPDLIQQIKVSSDAYIKQQHFTPYPFKWQNGYGAFSYSQSQLGRVMTYIQRQEEHHRQKSFQKEYIELLKAFEVDYQEQYLFDFEEVYCWE